jgi:hypothetical protein
MCLCALLPQFSFRPEDGLSIPMLSELKAPTSRLLLRVRVRRNKRTGEAVGAPKVDVVGAVASTFAFKAIADFQYLTLQSFAAGDSISKSRVGSGPSPTPPTMLMLAHLTEASGVGHTCMQLETIPASFVPSALPGLYAYHAGKPSVPGGGPMDLRR